MINHRHRLGADGNAQLRRFFIFNQCNRFFDQSRAIRVAGVHRILHVRLGDDRFRVKMLTDDFRFELHQVGRELGEGILQRLYAR